MFSRDTYKTRRDVLRKSMSGGIALFIGNDEVGMNYTGNVYPFRQDSTFLYYFGIDVPGLFAIIDFDGDQDILFGNDPSTSDIVWTRPVTSIKEFAENCGISTIKTTDDLPKFIGGSVSKGIKVHFLNPYRHKQTIFISELFQQSPSWVEANCSEELVIKIVDQRSIKEDQELEELDEATTITGNMHKRAMEFAHPGMLERDVMAEVYKVALSEGVGVSFPPIVSIHGEVLHNQYFDNRLDEGQLLLVDCGAENSRHYAGDMTRTFPVSKNFTSQQKEIYAIVLEAQKSTAEALKPGVPYKDIHLIAAKIITTGLKDLGVMHGNVEEAVEAGAHALFFPHGLGHMIGLDVHDMENFGEKYVGYDKSTNRSEQFGTNHLRLAKKLIEGNVLTIEPGIYFISTLISIWKDENKFTEFINYQKLEAYSDFGGIRIEEDFAITSKGNRLLGKPVAKEINDVEQVRNS